MPSYNLTDPFEYFVANASEDVLEDRVDAYSDYVNLMADLSLRTALGTGATTGVVYDVDLPYAGDGKQKIVVIPFSLYDQPDQPVNKKSLGREIAENLEKHVRNATAAVLVDDSNDDHALPRMGPLVNQRNVELRTTILLHDVNDEDTIVTAVVFYLPEGEGYNRLDATGLAGDLIKKGGMFLVGPLPEHLRSKFVDMSEQGKPLEY